MKQLLQSTFTLFFFALFAGLAQTTPTPAPEEISGVEGTISISPNRGGPIRQGESDSSPLSHMTFEVVQDGKAVNQFQTDEAGHFRILLPPGHYVIARKNPQAIGSYGPFEVTVNPGMMTSVHWKCDSGLR